MPLGNDKKDSLKNIFKKRIINNKYILKNYLNKHKKIPKLASITKLICN